MDSAAPLHYHVVWIRFFLCPLSIQSVDISFQWMYDGRENLFSFSVNLLSLIQPYTQKLKSSRARFSLSPSNPVEHRMQLLLYSYYYPTIHRIVEVFSLQLEFLQKKVSRSCIPIYMWHTYRKINRNRNDLICHANCLHK